MNTVLRTITCTAVALTLFCGAGYATTFRAPGVTNVIEPAYTGQFGNKEETALRPYKWIWHGTKSLVYHTVYSFNRGNMKTPILGSAEGLRGLRRGTVELGESTFRGANFAVPPHTPQQKYTIRETRVANQVIERDIALRNTSDFLFSWYYFPLIKLNDHYPWEDDEKVDERLQEAREIREARREGQVARTVVIEETEVERAQRRYVPDRVEAGAKRNQEYRGNLLRLAR